MIVKSTLVILSIIDFVLDSLEKSKSIIGNIRKKKPVRSLEEQTSPSYTI